MKFSNGDSYEGYWQAGMKHGNGRYKWENNIIYEGNFWLDKREG